MIYYIFLIIPKIKKLCYNIFVNGDNLLESKIQTIENIDELILAYKNCTDEKKKRMLHISIVEIGMQFVKKIAGNIHKYQNKHQILILVMYYKQ